MNHYELTASLYEHCCRMEKFATWTEIPLGSIVMALKGVQRADVLQMVKSFTRPHITIYEVKASRADFQRDLRSGKWEGYREHCNRLYFAMPTELVKLGEVPKGVGLITLGKSGSWKVVKGATSVHTLQLTAELLLKLAMTPCNQPFVGEDGLTQEKRRRLALAMAAEGLKHAKAGKEFGSFLSGHVRVLDQQRLDAEYKQETMQQCCRLAAQLVDTSENAEPEALEWRLRRVLRRRRENPQSAAMVDSHREETLT